MIPADRMLWESRGAPVQSFVDLVWFDERQTTPNCIVEKTTFVICRMSPGGMMIWTHQTEARSR